jgi:hypothetical protein
MKSYIKLLENEPDNFNILAKLIELMRKAGKLQDV